MVNRAIGLGLFGGYGDGRFGPNDKISRGQAAVRLANYAKQVAGIQVSGAASDFASMADAKAVSNWAVPSVGWCFRRNTLSGAGGRIVPQGKATRAEAAKMAVVLHDML